jgi:hypothetical protein
MEPIKNACKIYSNTSIKIIKMSKLWFDSNIGTNQSAPVAQTKDTNSSPIAVTGLPVPRDRTGKVVRKPKKIVYLRRNKMMRKGHKEPEKHELLKAGVCELRRSPA